MSYSPTILARAEARLKQAQEAHRRQQAQQQAAIHQGPAPDGGDRPPPAPNRPRILAAALRQGANQEGALAALRRENLALQEEERGPPHPGRLPRRRPGGHPLCPCAATGAGRGRPCAPAWGTSAARSRSPNSPPCWTWGTSPSKPSAWTTTATRWTPSTAAPPGRPWPSSSGSAGSMGRGSPVPPHRNLFLYYGAPGAGEDLPVGLHRPDGGRERVLRGLRHRRQRLCPV